MHAFSRLKHELPKLTLSRVEGFTVSMIQSLSSEELTKICSALNRYGSIRRIRLLEVYQWPCSASLVPITRLQDGA